MRRQLIILFVFGVLQHFAAAQSYIIITVAGGIDSAGYSGDGGPATAAELYSPTGVALGVSGNILIADQKNDRIRNVNTGGIISTIAGNGSPGFSGDGGQATAAEIYKPFGVAADPAGNIYIADTYNNRIRKVTTGGVISTFAGNGIAGFSGDGGPATAAELSSPVDITLDVSGNIYFSDYLNNRIRMVTTGGIISTFVGNGIGGFSGDGGLATAAEIHYPWGMIFDASGNFYVVEEGSNRVRIVNTGGIINTFAGSGILGFSGDGGQATAAEFYEPTGITLDASGNVYIADQYNNRIRMVNASGIISTFTGNGAYGFSGDGGQATAAEINVPQALAMDASDNLYIADLYNERIRKVTRVLSVPTLSDSSGLIDIYPNPVSAELFVEYSSSNSEKVTIQVYDITGRTAIEPYSSDNINQGINKVTISVSSLVQGVYILMLSDGKNRWSKKFVKL
jgi:trimeric autotransporter adhesin